MFDFCLDFSVYRAYKSLKLKIVMIWAIGFSLSRYLSLISLLFPNLYIFDGSVSLYFGNETSMSA